MTYQRLIVGDPNIVRVWQAAQLARPCLVGVPLRSAACLDTLRNGLEDITDELDYVIVSVLTSLVAEEASATDVRGSSANIMSDVMKIISSSAKKSSRVEVTFILVTFKVYGCGCSLDFF